MWPRCDCHEAHTEPSAHRKCLVQPEEMDRAWEKEHSEQWHSSDSFLAHGVSSVTGWKGVHLLTKGVASATHFPVLMAGSRGLVGIRGIPGVKSDLAPACLLYADQELRPASGCKTSRRALALLPVDQHTC